MWLPDRRELWLLLLVPLALAPVLALAVWHVHRSRSDTLEVPLALPFAALLAGDLLLELYENGSGNAEPRTSPRHLQEAEHEVLLAAALHQVVGLEHQHVLHAQLAAAPADEVGHVVARHEGAGHGAARLVRHVLPRAVGLEGARGTVDVVGVVTEHAARLQALHEGFHSDVQVVEPVQPFRQVLLHGVQILLAGLERPDALAGGGLDVALVRCHVFVWRGVAEVYQNVSRCSFSLDPWACASGSFSLKEAYTHPA